MGERYMTRPTRPTRQERLIPNGTPRYVRIYDNGGETADRFTVVYTGNYNNIGRNSRVDRATPCPTHYYVGMSEQPTHPQGVCLHSDTFFIIDQPTYGHLGRKIKFADLPEACQQVVMRDYKEIWEIK